MRQKETGRAWNKREANCRSLETAQMRLVKARPWQHVFNFGLPDQTSGTTPGGLLLQVRPSPPLIGGWAELPRLAPSIKGSEPKAQPPDRHSPPQSSRSGLASHQEEMGISISGAGVGRIEGRVSDCSVAVISMGRRNTYFSQSMWSMIYEEEIRTGWIYTGSKG